MNSQMTGLQTYVTRDAFLGAITDRLEKGAATDIAFWKHSPGALNADSSFVGALERRAAAGARLIMVVTSRPSVGEWLEGVAKRLCLFPSSRVILVHERNMHGCMPALILDDSDVFLHLAWPTAERPENPYLGINVRGDGDDVRSLARSLRSAIHLAFESGQNEMHAVPSLQSSDTSRVDGEHRK